MLEGLNGYSIAYQRWLRINKLHPLIQLGLTKEIDEEWHRHIATGEGYNIFCMKYFGRRLEHEKISVPNVIGLANLQAIWEREHAERLVGEPAVCDRLWK